MKKSLPLGLAVASLFAAPVDVEAGEYGARSIPSVVVTVENSAPSRGTAQTPFWIGIHDGDFDLYDRGVALGAEGLVAAPAVERLAEDGAIGPLNAEFAATEPTSPQSILFGPAGPLVPGDVSSVTLQVDPQQDRYFSYASMILPSNDAFIANGNPLAHQLFNDRGRFVGKSFAVAGAEVLDAGTEVNDEIATNTAFLGQAAPDTGISENGVVELHPGFILDGFFPDGVLTHPILGNADFTAPNYRAATFSFRYVDLGARTNFRSRLSTAQEVSAELIDSRASGSASAVSNDGDTLTVQINFRRTTGPVVMAHLHLGQAGSNGPVVANLTPSINGNSVYATVTATEVVGPLADGADPYLNLLNELASGNIYINLHTEANPGGELRGQLELSRR